MGEGGERKRGEIKQNKRLVIFFCFLKEINAVQTQIISFLL
jgi:hypothetical protein